MPNFCGCTGESSVGRLHWPWRKHAPSSNASSAHRSTVLGESLDDTEIAKSPTLAKPEVDDSSSPRNSISKSTRPPVTFELSSSTRGIQENATSRSGILEMRNHSLDIDMDGVMSQNSESTRVANRTFPTLFNSRSMRASSRLYSNYHNPVLLRRGSLLVRSGRPLPASMIMSQQASENSRFASVGSSITGQPSPGVTEGHGTKERFLDESLIVTPFAQILARLRSVQANITWLTSQLSLKNA